MPGRPCPSLVLMHRRRLVANSLHVSTDYTTMIRPVMSLSTVLIMSVFKHYFSNIFKSFQSESLNVLSPCRFSKEVCLTRCYLETGFKLIHAWWVLCSYYNTCLPWGTLVLGFCIPLKYLPIAFFNNRLGTEDINCYSFGSEIFAPYIFNWRQIWTAGSPVKHTHSMPMKPRCCNSCRMRLGIVLLK